MSRMDGNYTPETQRPITKTNTLQLLVLQHHQASKDHRQSAGDARISETVQRRRMAFITVPKEVFNRRPNGSIETLLTHRTDGGLFHTMRPRNAQLFYLKQSLTQPSIQVQVFIDTLAAQRPNNLMKQEKV